jgi:hypothetical protein
MSHRIDPDLAKEYFKKEQELKQMQRDGLELPRNERKRKKYEAMRKKQDGFFWKMRDRIVLLGGKLPDGFKTEEEKKKSKKEFDEI